MHINSDQRLRPNVLQLLLHVFLLVLILVMILSTPTVISKFRETGDKNAIYFFVSSVILLASLVPGILIRLFRAPISATLSAHIICAHYLFTEIKEVLIEDVAGYSDLVYRSKGGTQKAVLIYLKDGNHIEFAEMNIRDIDSLIAYLNIHPDVKYFGSDEPKSLFFKRKFKYQSLVS